MQGNAPPGFERIHPIVGLALRAAHPSDWPSPVHRGDAPMPTLSGRAQLDLALWLVRELEPHLAAGERAGFDRALALAHGFLDGKPGVSYTPLAELATALRKQKPRSPALEAAILALSGARSLAKGGSSLADVNKFTSQAAATMVSALGGAPDRPLPSVRAFLQRLDDALLTRELLAMLAERALRPSRPPARVRHRPAGPGKLPALILAELDGGGYGLWVKLKTRWQWIEGDREHVLASIPDAHFAAAVDTLL